MGGKWYAGSSADTAVNHDILWKERVKSELDLLHDEDYLGQSVGTKRPSTARGRMQGRNNKHGGHGEGGFVHRPWDAAEVNRLRTAVQKHGVGAWDSMRHDSAFSGTLGAHTASALSNKWKKVEVRSAIPRGIRIKEGAIATQCTDPAPPPPPPPRPFLSSAFFSPPLCPASLVPTHTRQGRRMKKLATTASPTRHMIRHKMQPGFRHGGGRTQLAHSASSPAVARPSSASGGSRAGSRAGLDRGARARPANSVVQMAALRSTLRAEHGLAQAAQQSLRAESARRQRAEQRFLKEKQQRVRIEGELKQMRRLMNNVVQKYNLGLKMHPELAGPEGAPDKRVEQQPPPLPTRLQAPQSARSHGSRRHADLLSHAETPHPNANHLWVANLLPYLLLSLYLPNTAAHSIPCVLLSFFQVADVQPIQCKPSVTAIVPEVAVDQSQSWSGSFHRRRPEPSRGGPAKVNGCEKEREQGVK